MSRQAMMPAERELRSQLTRLLHDQPIGLGCARENAVGGNRSPASLRGQDAESLPISLETQAISP